MAPKDRWWGKHALPHAISAHVKNCGRTRWREERRGSNLRVADSNQRQAHNRTPAPSTPAQSYPPQYVVIQQPSKPADLSWPHRSAAASRDPGGPTTTRYIVPRPRALRSASCTSGILFRRTWKYFCCRSANVLSASMRLFCDASTAT